MPDKNRSGSDQKGSQGAQKKPFKDLDVRKEDVNKVKGGRAVRSACDPCGGGE